MVVNIPHSTDTAYSLPTMFRSIRSKIHLLYALVPTDIEGRVAVAAIVYHMRFHLRMQLLFSRHSEDPGISD